MTICATVHHVSSSLITRQALFQHSLEMEPLGDPADNAVLAKQSKETGAEGFDFVVLSWQRGGTG